MTEIAQSKIGGEGGGTKPKTYCFKTEKEMKNKIVFVLVKIKKRQVYITLLTDFFQFYEIQRKFKKQFLFNVLLCKYKNAKGYKVVGTHFLDAFPRLMLFPELRIDSASLCSLAGRYDNPTYAVLIYSLESNAGLLRRLQMRAEMYTYVL
jgi:hypothetical protein